MNTFESYVFNFDVGQAGVPTPTDFDTEVVKELHSEGCLEQIALAEAEVLRQTHPNLHLISENVAAYQRITNQNKGADRPSRIGFGIGVMVSNEANNDFSGEYYTLDASHKTTASFNRAQWWGLEMLLSSTAKVAENPLQPLHEAMDYYLDFRDEAEIHHRAARLGASVGYVVMHYELARLEEQYEELYQQQRVYNFGERYFRTRLDKLSLDYSRGLI